MPKQYHSLEINYLDVGQGDCTLITLHHGYTATSKDPIVKTILIDCGHSKRLILGGNKIQSNNVLLERLQEIANNLYDHVPVNIDVLVVTHFDEDHYNGITNILHQAGTRSDHPYRVHFQNTVVYDQGFILSKNSYYNYFKEWQFNVYGEQKSLPGMALFKKYLQAIYHVKHPQVIRNPGHIDCNIARYTEDVFCGWPENYENNTYITLNIEGNTISYQDNTLTQTLATQLQYWWPTKADRDETNNIVNLQYKPCNHILGMDLANVHFVNKVPIGLQCIAVNGWVAGTDFNGTTRHYPQFTDDQQNAFSIGMLLTFGNFSCFLGGDITSTQENELINTILKNCNDGLTVLKASHHGSENSTSSTFLKSLSPRTVVITCGQETENSRKTGEYKNIHGHPNLAVIYRLFIENSVKSVYMTWSPEHPDYWQYGVPSLQDVAHPDRKFFITGSAWGDAGNGNIKINIHEVDASLQNSIDYYVKTYQAYLSFDSDPMDTTDGPPTIILNGVLNDYQNDLYVDNDYDNITGQIDYKFVLNPKSSRYVSGFGRGGYFNELESKPRRQHN